LVARVIHRIGGRFNIVVCSLGLYRNLFLAAAFPTSNDGFSFQPETITD
jgi:hypothetical protein